MKRLTLSLMLGVMVLLSFGFLSADASENMTVKVNVLESQVSISVPDQVSFGNIASGYISERRDVDIINDGTVDVSVSADVDESYNGTIFQNLAFRDILDDPLTSIDFFEIEVLKPNNVGEERIKDIYMYLDLSDYDEEVDEIMNHNATVVFTAVPL